MKQSFSLRIVLLFGIWLSAVAVCGADLTIQVSPARLTEGMQGTLKIQGTSAMPELRESLPDVPGLRWISGLQQQTSIQSINGKSTASYVVAVEFLAEKAGEVTIPALKVRLNGKNRKTKPYKLRIAAETASTREPGKAPNQPIFAEVRIPDWHKESVCYVGQEFPLSLFLYVREPYQAGIQELPKWETGNGVSIRLHDYRAINPETPEYESITRFRQRIGDEVFTVYRFDTRFRPLAAGTLTLKVSLTPVLQDPGDFFGMRAVRRQVRAALPEITVRPLPALSAGQPAYCGLIGEWQVSPSLSEPPYRVAEPLTLKIELAGDGSGTPETFRPPTPDLPGFRVYPPETEEKDNRISLRYTLIPVREGESAVSLAFSTFDPAGNGAYRPFRFDRTVSIGPANALLPSTGGRTVIDSGTIPLTESPRGLDKREDILYPHQDLTAFVRMPLWTNAVIIGMMCLLVGLVFFLASILSTARRTLLDGNPNMLRKLAARRRRKSLLNKLKATPPDAIDPDLAAELNAYLNDMLELPAGMNLSEAAARLPERDREFAAALNRLAELIWLPELRKNFTPEFKERLLRGFSKLAVLTAAVSLLWATAVPAAFAADESEPVPVTLAAAPPATAEEALTAYDTGNFRGALGFYARQLTPDRVSPAVLYNMGNCYYQLGDLPRALVCYERAIRLAPRDPDVLENLNLVRRKLFLPEKYQMEHPLDLLPWMRDSLRLDEWMILAAFAVMCCFIALGLHARNRRFWLPMLLTGTVVAVICLAALAAQSVSLYSPRSALVARRNTPLYSLPSTRSGKVERQLKEGTEVRVEETRLGWTRVRTNGDEGWVKKEDILALWSPDQADLVP